MHEMEKGSSQIIRFQVSEFKDNTYADMRVFYDAGGEWKPTPKGLSIPPESWGEFKKGIEALDKELKERGLV